MGSEMCIRDRLCTPYLFSYDLVCLAIPLTWLAAEACHTEWRPWEKITGLAVYILPAFAVNAAELGIPGAPVLMMGLLMVTRRRASLRYRNE